MKSSKSLIIALSIPLLASCTKPLPKAIESCNEHAANATMNLVPETEIAKKHIDDQRRGAFIRCMKKEGYAPDKVHFEKTKEILMSSINNNQDFDLNAFMEKLESTGNQEMLRADSGYWRKE